MTEVKRLMSNKKFKKRKGKLRSDYQNGIGYLFLSPFLIGFFALTLFPILYSFYLSFTDFDLLGKANMIGLDNYKRMFTGDKLYTKSLKVTFFYAGIAVPVRLIFA